MQTALKTISLTEKSSRTKRIVRLSILRRKCVNATQKTIKRPVIREWYIS